VHAQAFGLSEGELQRYAEALGAALRPGHVVLLRGPMGAGKTTLTRAIAHGLRVHRPDRVRSPTFNICLVHDGPIPLHHVDLFRLAPGDDVASTPSPAFGALGLESLFDGTQDAVVVVEWADLASLPVDALKISLQPAGPDRRDVEVSARGERHAALVAILNGVPRDPA
jgi:tRNA threonylcarbamoyl adenosine modification protein YjeE